MRLRSRAAQALLASIVVVVAGCGSTTHTTANVTMRPASATGQAGTSQGRGPRSRPGRQAWQEPQPRGLPGPRASARVHHGRERPQRAARLHRPPATARRQRLPARHDDAGGPRPRPHPQSLGVPGPDGRLCSWADHREPERLDHLRTHHRAGHRPQLRSGLGLPHVGRGRRRRPLAHDNGLDPAAGAGMR